MPILKLVNQCIPIIKKTVGIYDISLWRKRWKKRIGKIIYHKKYTADDIVQAMKCLGLKKGSLVCIHASMMEFYNYIGTASQLIEKILNEIGPQGTLMMPAFPNAPHDHTVENYIFDVEHSPTGAGYLAETFRKYAGVKRSCNVRHSVCAIGPLTDYLIKDHTKGHDCWDTTSPWYRLCEKDGLVFNLGMPKSYIGTFHHVVESLLHDKFKYWAQFFNAERKFNYKRGGGN